MFVSADGERETATTFGRYYQDERVLAPELGFLIQTGI